MTYTISLEKLSTVTAAFNPAFIVVNGLPASGKSDVVSVINKNSEYNVIRFTNWDSAISKIDKWYDSNKIILVGCFLDMEELQKQLDEFTFTYMYTYPGNTFKAKIKEYTDIEIKLTNSENAIKLCKKIYADSIQAFDSKVVIVKTL